MALGIVSDDEFERELVGINGINESVIKVNSSNKVNEASGEMFQSEIKEIKRGRGIGVLNKSSDDRSLIASEAISGASVVDLVNTFNTSPSSISAYKNGATSTASYNNPDEELKEQNNNVRNHIVGIAQKTLIEAIKQITVEKMGEIKLKDVSGIARDMSSVMKNVSPSDSGLTINQNKVIIYKPRMKEEQDYEVLEVSE